MLAIRLLIIRLLIVLAVIKGVNSAICYGSETKASLQQLHKQMVDDLVSIRKDHPDSQPRVYSILDRLDKVYGTAQERFDEQEGLSDIVKKKDSEISALKHDVATLKHEHDEMKQLLKAADEKWEHERQQSKLYAEEKRSLEKKIQMLKEQATVAKETAVPTSTVNADKSERVHE